MCGYENQYLGVRIEVPDQWELTSWQHTHVGSDFQTRDNDLPTGNQRSKFLFTACLFGRPPMVDADIELSIYRLDPGENMRDGLITNFTRQREYYTSHGIDTSIVQESTWIIGGVSFQFVEQLSKSRNGTSRYRFFFHPLGDEFWLYGKIAGHRDSAYEAAIKIAGAIKFPGLVARGLDQ
jgi:hypothetical protein